MNLRQKLIWSALCGVLIYNSPAAGQKLSKQAQRLIAMTPADFERAITIKDDPLDTTAQISTEQGFQEKRGLLKMVSYDSFLRAFIDKKTGVTDFQVYVYVTYGGSWRFYHTANFEAPSGPESQSVTVIDRDVSCMSYGCSYTEHVGFNVPEDQLRWVAARYASAPGSIWRFKIGSKAGGDWQDGLATAEVAGLLAVVDRYRASRGLKVQQRQAPPIYPVEATTPPVAEAAPEETPAVPPTVPAPTAKKKRPAVTCLTCN